MLELIKNTKIDFMGKRNIAFIFSGILSIIGIMAMIQIATGKANLGIDFAGGTSIQLKFEKPVVLHDVRKALEEGGLKDFDLQDLPTVNKILIRVKRQSRSSGRRQARQQEFLAGNFLTISMLLIPRLR